jgi:transcriptional regulator with PAS, ATPase and Fis domain
MRGRAGRSGRPYFRINVIDIHDPPLGIAGGHHPPGRTFLEIHSAPEASNTFSAPKTAALQTAYPWPGNVRELENAM